MKLLGLNAPCIRFPGQVSLLSAVYVSVHVGTYDD